MWKSFYEAQLDAWNLAGLPVLAMLAFLAIWAVAVVRAWRKHKDDPRAALPFDDAPLASPSPRPSEQQ